MKLIIDIDESLYDAINQDIYINGMRSGKTLLQKLVASIGHGTPITNATNGDVMKAMFDVEEIDMSNTYCVHFPEEEDYSHYFFKEWWNAPYQKGGK